MHKRFLSSTAYLGEIRTGMFIMLGTDDCRYKNGFSSKKVMATLCIRLSFILVCTFQVVSSQEAVKVFENETATLVFSYSNRNENQTIWLVNSYQSGYATCTNCGSSPSNNCTARGFLNQTNYNIKCYQSAVYVSIINVARWHHGNWSCNFLDSSDLRTFFVFVKVRISEASLNTSLFLGENNIVKVRENTIFTIICKSSYCRPNATIKLFQSVNGKRIVISENTTYRSSNDSLFQTISTFNLSNDRTLTGINLSCIVSNEDGMLRTNAIVVDVMYPPDNISIDLITDEIKANNIASKFSVQEGNRCTLICSANGNPVPWILWEGFSASNNRSLMLIATRNQSGYITCHASNNISEYGEEYPVIGRAERTYFIDILYPPETEPLHNKSVIEGRQIKISTQIIPGNPTTTSVQWLTGLNVISYSSNLTIANVSRNDERLYFFSASNTMRPTYGLDLKGYSNSSFYLEVLYPPENVRANLRTLHNTVFNIPSRFTVIENTYLNLSCSADGKPKPSKYAWSGIVSSNSATVEYTALRDVSGNVTCSSSNVMVADNVATTGNTSKTYALDVLYPPEINVLENMTVVEGANVSINCLHKPGKVTSLSMSWIRRGYYVDSNGTLMLPRVTRHETGNFTCELRYTMTPTYGESKTDILRSYMYLDVLYRAEISAFYVRNYEPGRNITVNEGDNVNFLCEVDSKPSSTIEIMNNDQILSKASETRSLSHSLGTIACMEPLQIVCAGYNSLNKAEKATKEIQLYVTCSPRQSSSANVENIISVINRPVTFSFSVIAYPSPVLHWYQLNNSNLNIVKNGIIKVFKISAIESQINLTLPNVTIGDYGEYILRVVNDYGEYGHRFYLSSEEQSKASPPDTDNSATVTGVATGLAIVVVVVIIVAVIVVLKQRRTINRQVEVKKQDAIYINEAYAQNIQETSGSEETAGNSSQYEGLQFSQGSEETTKNSSHDGLQCVSGPDHQYQVLAKVPKKGKRAIYENLSM